MEFDNAAVREYINANRGSRTYEQVAREIGTTGATLSRIMHNHHAPSLGFILSFLRWRNLGYNLEPFLKGDF